VYNAYKAQTINGTLSLIMKYIVSILIIFSFIILPAQKPVKFQPTDSSINQLFDSLTFLKNQAQTLNKIEPQSKKHHESWGKYNNYFDISFRPNLKAIIEYIVINKKDLLENSFLKFLSISTGSADEELSRYFAYLFILNPEKIILKLEKLGKPNLNKYLEGSFEFYTYENPIDSSEFNLLNQKIKQLMLTQK
tara:strand:- start:5 stop:583 length:579 start_codon:yes stop_codon:yes gene_type:complete